jgi:hypothetical protein
MDGQQVGGSVNPGTLGVYDWVSPDQKTTVSVFGSYDTIQAVDLNDDGFTDVSERELTSGGLRATWKPQSETKLTFDYFASDEGRRGGEAGAAFDEPPNLAAIAEEIFSFRQVATLKWEQELTDTGSMQNAYAYSGTRRDSYYGARRPLARPIQIRIFSIRLGRPSEASAIHQAICISLIVCCFTSHLKGIVLLVVGNTDTKH